MLIIIKKTQINLSKCINDFKEGEKMYSIIKAIVIIFCIGGILYLIKEKVSYKNDNTSVKEEIINYFKVQKATNIENGIKTKDLPDFIAKSSYRLLMIQDKTLIFKKGKYYLNTNRPVPKLSISNFKIINATN